MHTIRIYTGNRSRDGIIHDTKLVLTFNGFNRELYAKMQHAYPEGNGYIWLH